VPSVVISLKARHYQKPVIDFFRDGGKHAYEVWHRRAGKDRVATFIESELAMKRVGLYWHCLPEYKHARRVIWDNITKDGQKLLDLNFPSAIVKRKHEQDMKIELVNGSIWQLVGSDNFDALVGANPVHVTYSEFALTHPKSRDFVRPILAENNGSELLITTPRGYNHAHKLWKQVQGDPRWHTSIIDVDESGVLTRETIEAEQREMPDELFRQEYYCDWSAANVGAIFGKYMEAAEKEGRIANALRPDPMAELVVSSDIGYRDKAAFWWWRPMKGGFELVDYDEASGLDAEEWCSRLKTKPPASLLLLPHDARAKSFLSRHSAVEIFLANARDHFADIRVNAVRKKSDSINAGRKVLKQCRFDGTACETGIEALRFYHYKYLEDQKIFSSEPEHDWSSHAADAFMEGAAALQDYVAPPAKPADPYDPLAVTAPINNTFKLDDLWDTCGPSQGGRRV
jgi:phage terminase large subunit